MSSGGGQVVRIAKVTKVWEHFTLDALRKKVTCKFCKADVVYHGSTSVLHEHLMRGHVEVLEDIGSPW